MALASNPLFAAVILSPVAVAGSDLGEYGAETPYVNMINQSGIALEFTSGSTDFDEYFAVPGEPFGNANYVNNWQSPVSFDLPLSGYVDFDLGETYTVGKMAIWSLSLRDVHVELFEELNGTRQSAGSWTLTNQLSFPFSYRVEVLPFTSPLPARYVRLNIESVYTFSPTDDFGYAIVGEVAFSVEPPTATVPLLQIDLNPNGDVTVTFTGTLESASAPDGAITDVPGNPQGTHTLTPSEPAVYFRARMD
jgi:hypothetical protein